MELPGPMVSPEWLLDHCDEVRIVDVRWAMDGGPKLAEFEAGHLPGAVFADLDVDLSDSPGERGRHPLPSPEHFAVVRSRLGLESVPVVAYDDQSGAVAARLWWMLDAVGHPAAVLDGGIQAWTGDIVSGSAVAGVGHRSAAAGPAGAAESGDPDEAVEVVPWPADRFIVAQDIEAAVAGGALLLDARSRERFAGRPNPIDARPGHIPGSVSRPWTENVGSDGRLLDRETLAAELADLGVGDDVELITSCGSGVTGCHELLAARVAGFQGGRLYAGSWSEWQLDPDRPVAVDPDIA